jgi:two-component system chemotaxis response regulator CheB
VDVVHPSGEVASDIIGFAQRIIEINVKHEARGSADPRIEGSPSVFTCPDCGGTLWEVDDEGFLHFRCRTGHSYNSNSMLAVQRDSIEQSLWSAIRVLEERADLLRRIGRRARDRGDHRMADRLGRQEDQTRGDQAQLQKALSDLLSQPWLPEAYSNKGETIAADVGE